MNISGWGLSASDAPNAFKRGAVGSSIGIGVGGASSFHPGGTISPSAMAPVKFLKETIGTWAVDPTNRYLPVGISYGATGGLGFSWGTTTPKVYQALSTRGSGEVISSDSY